MSDKKANTKKFNWGMFFIGIGVFLLVILGTQAYNKFKLTFPYIAASKKLAAENQALQSVLGKPIQTSYLLFNFQNKNGEWLYDFQTNGPKGKAVITVRASKSVDGNFDVHAMFGNAKTFTGKRYMIVIKMPDEMYYKNFSPPAVNEMPHAARTTMLGKIDYLISFFISDDKQRIKWLQKAVDNGSVAAANDLAIFYDKGRGVKKDIVKATALFEQGAENGDAYAMYNLGLHLRTSSPPNYALAVKWYEKSLFTYPNACAFNDLAILYAKGQGVKQDTDKATSLFIDAAHGLFRDDFYNDLTRKIDLERIAANREDAITAFVEYQYANYVYDKTIEIEKKFPQKAVEIAKAMSNTIVTRCWS